MEEHVGQIWHRLITRAAATHHRRATVYLDEVKQMVGVLFHALGGDGGLRVENAPATAHAIRWRYGCIRNRHIRRTVARAQTRRPPPHQPTRKPIYEGRYGVEDTRMAIIAARRAGLQPFCVTIDERAEDYLPHLFGSAGFVLIRKPTELPRRLPQLYA